MNRHVVAVGGVGVCLAWLSHMEHITTECGNHGHSALLFTLQSRLQYTRRHVCDVYRDKGGRLEERAG